jgi:hypothetical protein
MSESVDGPQRTKVVEPVEQVPDRVDVAEVAACTAKAAHGRDHSHGAGAQCCHPHSVEVIHLGNRALTVCHDCEADTGFLPREQAESVASRHQKQTLVVSVQLLDVAAS